MSHTLEEVRREYDRLDRLCRADTSGIELRISKRMTRTLGKCAVQGEHPVRITLADFLLTSASEDVFRDVIRHEYALSLIHI